MVVDNKKENAAPYIEYFGINRIFNTVLSTAANTHIADLTFTYSTLNDIGYINSILYVSNNNATRINAIIVPESSYLSDKIETMLLENTISKL